MGNGGLKLKPMDETSESGQWAKLAAVALQWLCPRQPIAACVVGGKRNSETVQIRHCNHVRIRGQYTAAAAAAVQGRHGVDFCCQ